MSEQILSRLAEVIERRMQVAGEDSYVAKLHAAGLDFILKKIGEEAAETLVAAKNNDKQAVIHETADLWFHNLVLLVELGIHPEDILNELHSRFGRSGLAEKASRKKT